MGPIVTEVENIDELLSWIETRELRAALVENRLIAVRLGIWHSNTSAIAELEFM